jgi:hypothetical protein
MGTSVEARSAKNEARSAKRENEARSAINKARSSKLEAKDPGDESAKLKTGGISAAFRIKAWVSGRRQYTRLRSGSARGVLDPGVRRGDDMQDYLRVH